ncbi:MAG: sterol desaturase family protein [Robiginitomaculum sp.]|nr:sterol desaturase family protein [Robiginitomaculum sp.]
MSNPQFPDLLLWAIPFFIVCIGFEIWWLKHHPIKNAYTFKDARTSIIMGIGSTISDILLKVLLVGSLFWVWQFRFFDLGASIWIILLALVATDFVYYWIHFIYHKSRWFWATHVVHHSSEHFNLTTALRQQWTNGISGTVLFKVPLVLLGIHPGIIVFVMAINLIYQFWFHTETIAKMPRWFEFIFNTPSHHRVHHGRNARYLDCNYAGILIIWDRMFGTFVPELEGEDVDYGIVKPLKSYNPFVVAFHEFFAIGKDIFGRGLTLGQRFKYLFAPPGYSHDNSRQTVAQIKAEFIANNPEQEGTPGLPER